MNELKNITEAGAPESRITEAGPVLDMVRNLISADEKRAKVRSRVKGLVDGNAPYNAAELKRTGRSFQCNVNFRESEAFLAMAAAPFYDVFSEVPTYSTVRINYGSSDESERYSRIVTEEFDRLQKKDSNFDYLMQLSQHEMVLYGTGPLVFEDTTDWRCKPVKSADLLVLDGTKSNVNDWQMAVVRSTYQVHELFSFIKSEEAASKMGWDVTSAKKAIMAAAPKGDGGGSNKNWEFYQQEIRNNDLTYSAKCNVIEVAHLFYKEFPTKEFPEGAISHCIIDERGDGRKFLFRQTNRYKAWSECVHCMYYDKGDGTHHSCKGIGIKFYASLELKNRLRNSLIDATVARQSIHITPNSPNALNRMNIIQVGAYSFMPSDVSVAQTNNSGTLEPAMAVDRELEGLMQANLSQYRQRLDKGGNPRTATEIDAITSQQSTLGKTQLNRYYTQLDTLFAERYRRASNSNLTPDVPGGADALAFQKACRDRGIPVAALKSVDYVQATRTAGRGSSMERRAIMNQLMNISGMLPETGRQNVIKDHIAAMSGYHSVERYFPVPQRDITMQEELQEAAIENALFKTGANIPISGGDSHPVHAASHVQAGGEALMAMQEGKGSPSEIAGYLSVIVQHTSEHLNAMANDGSRKEMVKELSKQLQQLSAVVQQLEQQAAQQAEQQQAAAAEMQSVQGGQDSKDQLAAMRMERDEGRKDAKVQNDMARKNAKTEQDLQLKDAKTAQKMALEDSRNANTIERE